VSEILDYLLAETQEHEQAIERLGVIRELLKIYPKLKRETGRWGSERFYTLEVNRIVLEADIWHSCSCCPDAPLFISPYIVVNSIKVFSDPPKICIGQMNAYGYGEIPDENWEETLKNHNLPETIIEQVRIYFTEYPESNRAESDRDDENE